jgi:hypothetical protein
MNRNALALSALLSLFAARAYGGEGPRFTLQVDPLTTALGYVHLQVERAVSPAFSVYAGPHLHLFDSLLAAEDEDFLGLGAEVGARWFFYGEAPRGAWVMGRAVLARVSTEVPAPEVAAGGYASALVGYTAIVGGRLVLSGGAGVQYIDYNIAGRGAEGVFPALHTAIGFAF